MLKYILAGLFIIGILVLAGLFPHIAVYLTAISIVFLFLIFGN